MVSKQPFSKVKKLGNNFPIGMKIHYCYRTGYISYFLEAQLIVLITHHNSVRIRCHIHVSNCKFLTVSETNDPVESPMPSNPLCNN